MADVKFVKSFLVSFFIGFVVKNGFCGPIFEEVVLSNGTVLKMVLHEVVHAPPPRYESELDGGKKDENEPLIIIYEAQSAPPPRIMSKRGTEDDDDDGDDDEIDRNEPKVPTVRNNSDGEPVKANTPSVATRIAQTTTVLGLQKQNTDENKGSEKNGEISESPKSETQSIVAGQHADKDADEDADEYADEDGESEGQDSTLQTPLPTRPINNKVSSEATGSKVGSVKQEDAKSDVDNQQSNISRNDVDDQSNAADDENDDDDELGDNRTSDEINPIKLSDENTEDIDVDPADTAGENIKVNNGDEDYGDDNDDDDSNNRNADEGSKLDENDGEVSDEEGERKELDRSGYVKKPSVSESQSSGHFMLYFLIAVVFVACFYVVFHNRQKIKAYVLEGRHGRGGRRRKAANGDYRQLSTAEEVLPSADKEVESKTTYTY